MNQSTPTEQPKVLRTPLLIICVLSLISVACSLLTDMMFSYYESMPRQQLEQMMSSVPGQTSTTEVMDMLIKLISVAKYHLLFCLVELVGIVLLLMRKYIGFHFYVASAIGHSYVFYMVAGFNGAMSTIFLNLMWVLLYFRFSKYLNEESK